MFSAFVVSVAALSITLNGCGSDPCSGLSCSDFVIPSTKTVDCLADDADAYKSRLCDQCTADDCPETSVCYPLRLVTGCSNSLDARTDKQGEVTTSFQQVLAQLGMHNQNTGIVV